MKSFHIWDFPDSIYILLDENAKSKFFEEVYQKFGNRERYAKFLKLDPSTVREYQLGFSDKNKKKWVQYVPIKVLKKSKKFLTPKTIKLIENNILAYRPRAGSPIKNPILPIKESPTIYRLLGHIFGDGSATKRKVPYYANTCKELREEFVKDLQIFGQVECTNNKLTVPIVSFQKAITQILAHIFNISFDEKDKLPEKIFSTPMECKCALLRALFDDEGCVSTGLVMSITGPKLVEDICKLLAQLKINHNTYVSYVKNRKPVFTIRISSKSILRFADLIGFQHPKKSRKLKAMLKRKDRKQRYKPIKTIDKLILNYLNQNKISRTIDIANHIQLSLGHTLVHLKRMEKEKKINRKLEFGRIFIWNF